MAPMILLYFVGVLVSYVVLRRKRAGDVATGEAH
jgi:Sec-independent protein secretion pathway component TatC